MVPFFDLTRQHKVIKKEIDTVLKAVYKKGIYTLGDNVRAFEEEFASYVGVKHAMGVASGTDALTLTVKALGLVPGDEVILPANAYPSVFGVALSGVTIKLVDCDEHGLMDLALLEKTITKRTKAVIPVHMYGQPVDIILLQTLLSRFSRKIYIIEDAAQGHGASVAGCVPGVRSQVSGKMQKVGGIGDIGIFSFYPTKNLGAYGDGGLVVTQDGTIHKRLLRLRQYGEISRYQSVEISGVSRLDEVQAAILRVKLRYLDEWNGKRRKIAEYYARELNGTGDIVLVSHPGVPNTSDNHTFGQSLSSGHLCVIRTGKRNELKEHLASKGIMTAIHYPVPIHLTPSFSSLGYAAGNFPVSERLSRTVLSLPLFPELKDRECQDVCRAITSYFSSVR